MDILENEENGFEERADYLSEDELIKWNVDIPYFNTIQKKLIEKGAKVIVGPRGSGKTHQMKIAYNNCLKVKNKPLAIYVSFNKYYHLEPLLSKNPAAITIFHTWVLCKIILACIDTVRKLNKNEPPLNLDKIDTYNNIVIEKVEKFVAHAEKDVQETWHSDILNNITIQYVIDYLSKSMALCGRKRIVLLLDDAALTLTKEYMIEFFDIFRSLKTLTISPKASVYPGTTEYGPRFHLKQDADPHMIWFEPEGQEYADFINELCKKRFNSIEIDDGIKELLKYASFGNPRAFIILLKDYEENRLKTTQVVFNEIVDTRCKLLKDEYLSIKQKLSQYSTIIDTGWEFFEEILKEITTANRKLFNSNKKQIVIGLLDNRDKSIERMIKFLIEAGLLYELGPVKHGENREYKRFIPHLIFLFQKRAFSKSRGFNINEILEFLKRKNYKHPLRKDNISKMINTEMLNLNLPPCTHCGASRLSENQKFCHICGNELISRSSFEKCMQLTIDKLPLTEWQKTKIMEETDLKTVKDFLSIPDIGSELRKPHGIGQKRAETIINKVYKLIEEFLA
ncbi:MAG TPA: hypothetical protein PK566_08640 [Pseudobacteroides sp.]|nr:hypothetical protein [Pseudobacteroides sp.]